jgi:hypothetical protein
MGYVLLPAPQQPGQIIERGRVVRKGIRTNCAMALFVGKVQLKSHLDFALSLFRIADRVFSLRQPRTEGQNLQRFEDGIMGSAATDYVHSIDRIGVFTSGTRKCSQALSMVADS